MARTNKDKIAKLQAEIKALEEQEEREEKGIELFRLLLNASDSERHLKAMGDNLAGYRSAAKQIVDMAVAVEDVLKQNRAAAKKAAEPDSSPQSEYQPEYQPNNEQEQTQQY